MNPDKRFANKLKATLKKAQTAAEIAFPGEPHSQRTFVMGWLEAEAGLWNYEEVGND